jgi:hypothetical protein
MNENEMGYRGSKSNCNFNNRSIQIKNYSFVKEQRVDGSCFINNNKKLIKLRYTLKGGASYYQTKIPSKQIVIQTKTQPLSSCLCKATSKGYFYKIRIAELKTLAVKPTLFLFL